MRMKTCSRGLFKNMTQKVKMLEDNLIINTNVLKASHEAGVKRLIACLSTCIFPDYTCYPINGTMIHDGPPHSSNEGYAYSKRMLEVQCRMYNEQFQRSYTCIIPTNIYGPYDNFNLDPQFLSKINDNPLFNKTSFVKGIHIIKLFLY